MLTLMTLINMAAASNQPTSTFRLNSGETLSHYAQWSGVSVADIEQDSGLDSSGVYSIGTPIQLSLTPDMAESVEAARSEYLQQRFDDWSEYYEIYSYEHSVSTGETAWSIALDHGIDLWHIETSNPGVDLSELRPGQTLHVPIREEGGC
jgi:LysM repeat protein